MQENTIAIILAAGRGSRMKGFTDHKPKCLLSLAGKKLLHWQLESLSKGNFAKIIVVRGYLAQSIQGDFDTVENTRWAETNMVSSLLCALDTIKNTTVLVSYSDIVYKSSHISALLQAQGDICITYDTAWESLWRLRNDNPLDDAETFKQKQGLLVEIGQKTQHIEDIQGQYMGLIKFTPEGQEIVKKYIATLRQSQVDTLDMTALLRGLLGQNIPIHTQAIHAGWCECDTQQDMALYEEELQKNPHWAHDWREIYS